MNPLLLDENGRLNWEGNEPMVGSYSSMNRDRINDIVTADLPTPPSPSTCILMTLFSTPIAELNVLIDCGLHVLWLRENRLKMLPSIAVVGTAT